MENPEQEAEEIMVELGFIESEELESEMAQLLRQHHERILQIYRELFPPEE